MIDARELRIGNKLYNGTVVVISENGVTVFDGYSTWTSNKLEFEPLPLTEELLLKCGFEKIPILPHSKHERGNFVSSNKLMAFQYLKDCYFYSGQLSDIEIKYLHQLQNLHYALTGEELEVKE